MVYHVNESALALGGEFSLFVKGGSLGVAPTLSGLPGSIIHHISARRCGELCGALQHIVQHHNKIISMYRFDDGCVCSMSPRGVEHTSQHQTYLVHGGLPLPY